MQKRLFSRKLVVSGFLILGSFLASCTSKKNPDPAVSESNPAPKVVKVEEAPKDRILQGIVRVFEQADSVHREAWWVIAGERRPFGKSPFGKVQRALMSSMNLKLANKSAFRCDRYVVKRDVLSAVGYPQKAEVFEKCSDKAAAKKLADWSLDKVGEIKVIFYTDGLEEVLGLGATVMLSRMECRLEYNDADQLTLFNCKDWAQERSQTQMVRLDTYSYQKDKKSLLKLRGKVYENLTELRKIEVDIPLEGKIKVTETELYAPEEPKVEPAKPTPVAVPGATPGTQGTQAARPGVSPQVGGTQRTPLQGPGRPAQDPDMMLHRQRAAEEGWAPGTMPQEDEGYGANEGAEGEEQQEEEQAPAVGPGMLINDDTGEAMDHGTMPDPLEKYIGQPPQAPGPQQPGQQQGVPHGR